MQIKIENLDMCPLDTESKINASLLALNRHGERGYSFFI